MVHGGPRAWARPGLAGEHAELCHMTPKLTARAHTTRGGRGEHHQWNRGQTGGLTRLGNNETKRRRTKLGAMANRAWRRETRGGIGCGGGRGCSQCLL
jgi:hypothetical protein